MGPKPQRNEPTLHQQLGLRPWVTACEFAEAAAVRFAVVIENLHDQAVGIVMPPVDYEWLPESPEFAAAFASAFAEPSLGGGGTTYCGLGPQEHVRLDPGQSMRRATVAAIAGLGESKAKSVTVQWTWRQFDLARPYEERSVVSCSEVELATDPGRCEVKAQRELPCPFRDSLPVDLSASAPL